MCTSIISNRKKTLVGWNLDILNMEHRVTVSDVGVFIEINDANEAGYRCLVPIPGGILWACLLAGHLMRGVIRSAMEEM